MLDNETMRVCNDIAIDISNVFIQNSNDFAEYINSNKELDIYSVDFHSAVYRNDEFDYVICDTATAEEIQDYVVERATLILAQQNLNVKLISPVL